MHKIQTTELMSKHGEAKLAAGCTHPEAQGQISIYKLKQGRSYRVKKHDGCHNGAHNSIEKCSSVQR
jgi:hypothetical protein